jgi:CheY-like chemotaxis protein
MGRGTTVRMILPVHHGPVPEAVEVRAAEPRPDAAPVRPGATILVVEDSEEVLALARENLVEMGYQVLAAVDGREALEVLDRVGNRIDLLFTDLVMPGSINGLMLAEEMRRRAPDVPILLTTGYNEDLAQSERAPGMDVLGKPYRRSELADRVRGALQGAGRTGPRRQASDFGPAEE